MRNRGEVQQKLHAVRGHFLVADSDNEYSAGVLVGWRAALKWVLEQENEEED
jgi:hypothetical protein